MTSLLTGHNCNLLFIAGNGYLCKCEGCGAHRSNHQEIFPLLSVARATWAALLFSFLFPSRQEKLIIPPYKTGPQGLNKEKGQDNQKSVPIDAFKASSILAKNVTVFC